MAVAMDNAILENILRQVRPLIGQGKVADYIPALATVDGSRQNRKVVAWAKQHGIHITSYMTLAYGNALKDKVIARIAAKHNATPAQVILAWAMGEGYSVIPSSTKRENLESNLKAQNLQLDAEDKKAIAALDCNDRLVSPEGLAPEWD